MVFIARQTNLSHTISYAYRQREIEGFTSTEPPTLMIKGIAHQKEESYTAYAQNIDIFVSATSRQMRLRMNVQGALINLERTTFSPDLPPLDYIYGGTLSDQDQTRMLQKFAGMSPIKKVKNKEVHFILSKPNLQKASLLFNTCKKNTVPENGTMNAQDLYTINFLAHLVTEFLATQTYPAWKNATDGISSEELGQNMSILAKVEGLKRKILRTEAMMSKRARHEVPGMESRMAHEDDETMEDEIDEEAMHVALVDHVITAKPSPQPFSRNAGGPGDVPSSPGMVFQYFDRSLAPDRHIIRTIVTGLFWRCLGDSRAAQQATYKILRPSMERLPHTELGAEFVHLFLGIRLALETQTRMFVVNVAGKYAGFVLLGARFSVLIDTVWHEAMSAEELKVEVGKMSSHAQALSEIAECLTECGVLDVAKGDYGDAEEVKVEDIDSGNSLWEALRVRDLDAEAQEYLSKRLPMVSFTRGYKEINAVNIAWALDMVTSKASEPIPDDVSLYVPPAFTQLNDRVLRVLCCFGPDSFSFMNLKGSDFPITSIAKEVDPNDVLDQRGAKAMPVMIVAIKGVLTCAGDLRKVMKERKIRMDLKERAAPHRCIVYKGTQRDSVYLKLREVLGSGVIDDADLRKGTKRKAEEEIATIDKISSVDAFLDMF